MSSSEIIGKGRGYQSKIEAVPGIGAPWRAQFLHVMKELSHIIPSLLREVTPTGTHSDLYELWKSIQHCLSLIPKWEEQLHVALGEICEAKVKWNEEWTTRFEELALLTSNIIERKRNVDKLEKQASDCLAQVEMATGNLMTIRNEIAQEEDRLQAKLTELQTVVRNGRHSTEASSEKEKELQDQENDLISKRRLNMEGRQELFAQRLDVQKLSASVSERETQALEFETRLEEDRQAIDTERRAVAEPSKALSLERHQFETEKSELQSQLEEQRRQLQQRIAANEASNATLRKEQQSFDKLIERLSLGQHL